jgi:hypothetical protein
MRHCSNPRDQSETRGAVSQLDRVLPRFCRTAAVLPAILASLARDEYLNKGDHILSRGAGEGGIHEI